MVASKIAFAVAVSVTWLNKAANGMQVARPGADGAQKEDGESVKKMLSRIEQRLDSIENRFEKDIGSLSNHEDGSRVPTRLDEDFKTHDLPLFDRLRYLERKVDGNSNWLKDPQLYERTQHLCENETNLETDHYVCFDKWEQALKRNKEKRNRAKCVVYDLGVRENPEFGVNFMKQHGCSVRAYDPSPISQKWWSENGSFVAELKEAGEEKYKFVPIGAGGSDDSIELYEYSWDQVSIYKAENDLTKRPAGAPDQAPKAFNLPVKTLETMMRDNGDSYIDVLKVDIEGSEYLFLQDIFDRMGCPPVGQIQMEWHAFSVDSRYGSPPEMNVLHNLLNSCGFTAFHSRDHWRNGLDNYSQGSRVLPPVRFTLQSFCKDCIAK